MSWVAALRSIYQSISAELMVWLDTAGARGLSAVAAWCQTHSLAALFTLILPHYREFIDITHQMTNRESYIGAVLKRRLCVYPKVLYAQCGIFLDYFLHIQKNLHHMQGYTNEWFLLTLNIKNLDP